MRNLVQKPILSLCIPTYNRSQYLRRCIDSIICQEEFQNGLVEIVISDNASDDDTQAMVQDYTKKHYNIIYSRNKKNVRDRNFPIVLGLGKGVLRKLCNDTLIFEPGSLNYMCSIVETYTNDCPHLFWANGMLKMEDEYKNDDFRDFVLDASFWITSIACFSIWENDCHDISNDTAGAELMLWQVRKSLELSHKKDRVVICNKRLAEVQNVEKKNISYGLYKVFYVNYFRLLEPYFTENLLKAEDREVLEKDLLFNFFMNWCINWEIFNKGFQYSKEENLKLAIESQYKNKPYWHQYIKEYNGRMFKRKVKRLMLSLIKR